MLRPPDPSPLPSLSEQESLARSIAQTAGLAHDAGNLLGALGLYCDLLRVPGVLRPEHSHYATELGLISSRSSALIARLLDLAPARAPISHRVDPSIASSNPGVFRLQPSDVRRGAPALPEIYHPGLNHAAVLRALAPVLQRIAAGSANVSVFVPATLPQLDLPVEALERITVNLVRNAVEALRKQQAIPASHPQGEIRVALGIVAGRLQLTVEDNGPGIPPLIAAAFLRPSALAPTSGRGLGHRIVHELVTSSGGQISIRTRPGQGTAFSLKWPLATTISDLNPSDPSYFSPSAPIPTAALRSTSVPAAQEGLST